MFLSNPAGGGSNTVVLVDWLWLVVLIPVLVLAVWVGSKITKGKANLLDEADRYHREQGER